jgi:two-component system, NarL family, sensor kinase
VSFAHGMASSRGLIARRPARRTPRVPGEVVRFVAAIIATASIIGVGVFLGLSQLTTAEAQRGAEEIARVQGLGVVRPILSDQVMRGDPTALAQVDEVVRNRVLDARTVRVKIWDRTGRILYSDESRLIGETFPLGADELDALGSNKVDSSVSDLSRPENRFERPFGKLLEVYLPLETPSGAMVLFETYQEFASVEAQQSRMMLEIGPVLLAGLLLLMVLAVPLAWSMARRLEAAGLQNTALVARAVEASETERKKIASDLHDGVVQRLVGTAMSLGAASRNGATQSGDSVMAHALQGGAAELREAVRELRTLIVKIAPTDLTGDTLQDALEDLVQPLRASGVEASVRCGDSRLDPEEAKLVFRVAQEALRNVARHSGAKRVTVDLASSVGGRTLTVSDDGRGLDPEELMASRRSGHVGLALLKSLAEDGGGTLRVTSTPGLGCSVELSLP